jgi:hypothetical protein
MKRNGSKRNEMKYLRNGTERNETEKNIMFHKTLVFRHIYGYY